MQTTPYPVFGEGAGRIITKTSDTLPRMVLDLWKKFWYINIVNGGRPPIDYCLQRGLTVDLPAVSGDG